MWPTDREQALDKIVLNKGDAWRHEGEVRYVSQALVKASLPFDGNALRGIILGERFRKDQVSFFGGLLRERKNRGFKHPHVYRLSP